jgi:outer membrane protein assembly factor BamB
MPYHRAMRSLGRRGLALGAIGVAVLVGARANAQAVEVPRDLGTLPQAEVAWSAPWPIRLYVAGEHVVEYHPVLGRVRALTADGHERWRLVLPPDDEVNHVAAAGGVVALALENEVIALDGRSGGRRWKVAGKAESLRTLGVDLLADFIVRPRDATTEDEDSWPRELTRLQGTSGRRLWRVACPDSCWPVAAETDEIVASEHGGTLVRLDAKNGRRLGSVKLPGELVLVDQHVAITSSPDGGLAKGGGGTRLDATSLSDARPLWHVTLGKGGPGGAEARRTGARLVVFTDTEVDVLDWASGTVQSRTPLSPEIQRVGGHLVVLSDGRVAGTLRSKPGSDFGLLAVVDPTQPKPVSLWALPGEQSLDEAQGDELLLSGNQNRWYAVHGTAPLPPPRSRLSLTDDVSARLDRLMAAGAAGGGALTDPEGTLPFLRRLGRDLTQGAVISRLERGAAADVPALVDLVAAPARPVQAALKRALLAIAAEVPGAPATRRLRLVRGGLALLEATPGTLPEVPVRAVGDALGTMLQETWRALPEPARAALALGRELSFAEGELPWQRDLANASEILDQAQRFGALLWRAPYPDLDGPLRKAVAAVGPTRLCPYPMVYYERLVPRRPDELTCVLKAPPSAAIRGQDWALWRAPAVGHYEDVWGMTHSQAGWSLPRYLGPDETARAVLAAGRATHAQRSALQRALQQAALDSDADGLPDALEAHLGLDPTRADSDGDGVPDDRDPSPLCAPPKRPLTAEEEIASDMAWHALGLRTSAYPALFELPDGAASDPSFCIEVPTLGGPLIVGSEKTIAALKARTGRLPVYRTGAHPLSPEGRERLRALDTKGVARTELREGSWGFHIAPLNAGGHRVVVARVGGRWRVVAELMRWVS